MRQGYTQDEMGGSLRARVAQLRTTFREEHAEMAERTRAERAAFVHAIHTAVTQRIAPQVAQLRATFRAEHAEMAERNRAERVAVVQRIRAYIG